MLTARALRWLLPFCHVAALTVAAQLGRIKCHSDGLRLQSLANQARAFLSCNALINTMVSDTGSHALSGGDLFNRHFFDEGCDIRIEGIHTLEHDDTYNIARAVDVTTGMWAIWRDFARNIVQDCFWKGRGRGSGQWRALRHDRRFYFEIVVSRKPS